MENIILNASDSYPLSLNVYEVENPKGVIQVIHGMEEHQNRYKEFAETLNQFGYNVITSDMRGHGENAKTLGYFKDKKGHLALLDDQKVIREFIINKYPNLPIIFFGHSMGTIISRNILQEYSSSYSKVILSGFPNHNPVAKIAISIAKMITLFKGPKYRSKLLHNLSIGSFNKTIKNPKTPVDWLSYNEDNNTKYMEDPLCGFGFKCSGFRDLFTLLSNMSNSKKHYKNLNASLPILMIYGKDDPCVGGVKGVQGSINYLNKVGFNNLTVIGYDNMRHEILNEKDPSSIYKDIQSFLK